MGKKRISITLDSKVVKALEKIKSKTDFEPSISSIINSLLKKSKEVQKNL